MINKLRKHISRHISRWILILVGSVLAYCTAHYGFNVLETTAYLIGLCFFCVVARVFGFSRK